MKLSPKAVTLLFIVDQDVADLLAFCVDAFFRNRPCLAILGVHTGSGRDDFPRFLAGHLHFVGVIALPHNCIPISVASNGVVLAVEVGSGQSIDRLPFRIRAFDSDLDALSDGFVCRGLALRRRARAVLRFRKIEFPRSNDGVSLRKIRQRGHDEQTRRQKGHNTTRSDKDLENPHSVSLQDAVKRQQNTTTLVIAMSYASASDIAFLTAPAPSAAYSDKSRILLQVEPYSRWKVSVFHYWKCLLTGSFTRKKAKAKGDFKA